MNGEQKGAGATHDNYDFSLDDIEGEFDRADLTDIYSGIAGGNLFGQDAKRDATKETSKPRRRRRRARRRSSLSSAGDAEDVEPNIDRPIEENTERPGRLKRRSSEPLMSLDFGDLDGPPDAAAHGADTPTSQERPLKRRNSEPLLTIDLFDGIDISDDDDSGAHQDFHGSWRSLRSGTDQPGSQQEAPRRRGSRKMKRRNSVPLTALDFDDLDISTDGGFLGANHSYSSIGDSAPQLPSFQRASSEPLASDDIKDLDSQEDEHFQPYDLTALDSLYTPDKPSSLSSKTAEKKKRRPRRSSASSREKRLMEEELSLAIARAKALSKEQAQRAAAPNKTSAPIQTIQLPQQVSQQVSQQLPQQVPQQLPQQIPQQLPQQLPQHVPQQLSHLVPQQLPQHVQQHVQQQLFASHQQQQQQQFQHPMAFNVVNPPVAAMAPNPAVSQMMHPVQMNNFVAPTPSLAVSDNALSQSQVMMNMQRAAPVLANSNQNQMNTQCAVPATAAAAAPMPANPMQAQPMPTLPIQAQPMPANPMPAQPTPANPMPAQPMPAAPPVDIDQNAMMAKLQSMMERTQMTQKQLQDWDRKAGLPKSHSQTMVNSARSRKQLQQGVILKKWNGSPLIELEGRERGEGSDSDSESESECDDDESS